MAPAAVAHAPAAPRANLLLFNFSLGFHHLSISHGTEVLSDALARDGYHVTVSGDPKDLTAARLANTDAIVWLSTTGSGAAPFSPSVKRTFENWMRCGGGNIGIHAVAGPLFTGWPAWQKIWGSTEGGEPLTETSVADDQTANYEGWGQFDVTVKVDDHSSPATAPWHSVTTFNARDEFYHWASDPSKVVPDFHELLGFAGFTDPRTAAQESSSYWYDLPVAFTGSFAHTNRDFYTNLGHSTTMFDDPAYVEHVVGGTDWVTNVRPTAGCLAAHGIPGRTEKSSADSASYAGSVTTTSAKPSTPGQAGCAVEGEAAVPADATTSSGTWKASFFGGMGDCNGQLDPGCSLGASTVCSELGHATAEFEAGEYYIDPTTDIRYQEPPITGTGTCAGSTFSGVVFVTWRDHGISVMSVNASGGMISGSVLKQFTLRPLAHQEHLGTVVTRPLILHSTEFVGGSVVGTLSLAACALPSTSLFVASVPGGALGGALTVTA